MGETEYSEALKLTVGDLIDNEAVAKYNEFKLDNIYIQNKVCQYS